MAKGKNKNANNILEINKGPVVKVIEFKTDEERENVVKQTLEDCNSYCTAKKEEADNDYNKKIEEAENYYNNKKEKADALEEKVKEDYDKDVQAGIEKIKKEALKEVEIEKEKVESLKNEIEEKGRKINDETIQLSLDKEKYKIELNEENYEQIKQLSDLIESYKEKINNMTEEKNKLLIEKEQLEDDYAFVKAQLASNKELRDACNKKDLEIDELKSQNATFEEMYNDSKEDNRKKMLILEKFGDNPEEIFGYNSKLEEENKELKDKMANIPSEKELNELRKINSEYERLHNDLKISNEANTQLEIENYELKAKNSDIESYRRIIKLLESQKSELQNELDKSINLYGNKANKVFATLSTIDEIECKESKGLKPQTNLEDICDQFRSYLENRSDNPLYYDKTTIRTFVSGFGSSRLMILEGLSGTGKSSLPRAFAEFLGAYTLKIPVQSSWKDRNDLLGFYNDFKKQYKETEFLKSLYRASHDKNNVYIILLDEMNLSRIEYYFADLLSILEEPNVEDWKLELISDFASVAKDPDSWPKLIREGKLQICDNTWFVGTANKDDSTFMITDKVYDRSVVIEFEKKGKPEGLKKCQPISISNEEFQSLFAEIELNLKDEKEYLACKKFLDETFLSLFDITFGNRIENQMDKFVPAFVECGGTVIEAMDVMFSRKVLRKLEGLYDENTKNNLVELKKSIVEENYKMPITFETINKLIKKM